MAFVVFLLVCFLPGISRAAFPAFPGSNLQPVEEVKKEVRIKLPKTLYCAMTPARDRYTVNLRPISRAIGARNETWEVQLFRNDHLVASLGKTGGGEELAEFVLFTLPAADADAFNSMTASRAEMAGGSDAQVGTGMGGAGREGREDILRSKIGRSFQLRVLGPSGELLASRKVILILN